ncbi:MAG: DUF2807 domain-containing protein [Bacteroidales bacterium]|nr:DUF2807 domain-containing protein [Bacteroidales bacterium]
MKKITNILLFSGLAVLFVLMVVRVLICFKVSDNENQDNDADATQKVETRNLESFNAIKNEGMCDIVYVQSEKSAVEITAPARYIDRFETDVDDGVLRIDVLGKIRGRNAEKFSIKVYSPTCRSIKNEGVGKISCDSLYSDTLIVKNEGVGSIELKKLSVSHLKADNEGVGAISVEVIDAEYVHLDNEGVGSVSISGKAETAKLINEGVGSIDASDLDCEDVGVSNEGLGKVFVKD